MFKQTHSKSSIFLMEIILNILFFAVVATICLQLFYKAHSLSEDSTCLYKAASTCQSVTEVCQSFENANAAISEIYKDSSVSPEKTVIYFDDNFLPCSKENSLYKAVLTGTALSRPNGNCSLSFVETRTKSEIYKVNFSTYTTACPDTYKGGKQ